ncbi:hypothetical protein CLOP_g10175 [Closterium sp. NIES-67]|nr:hypothetical protein CLOP_g10175 [Closterium sp. NIES-67]
MAAGSTQGGKNSASGVDSRSAVAAAAAGAGGDCDVSRKFESVPSAARPSPMDIDVDVDVDVDGAAMATSGGSEACNSCSTCDCVEGCTGGDTIEFEVTFRGQRIPLRMHPRSPLLALSTCLCAKLAVDPATLKLMVRARAHSSPHSQPTDGTATAGTASATAAKSQATPSLLRLSDPSVRRRVLGDAGIAHGAQITLLASTVADVAAVSALQAGPQAAAAQRVIGFDEEIERAIRRGGADTGGATKGTKERAAAAAALPKGPYTFHEFRTWQLPGTEMRPPVAEALALLHRLAADPGIVAVMQRRRWSVRLLSELPPEGLVGVSPVCLLGFNKNHGEEVCLRLRTDDLRGFRKYLAIRRTLVHELAHMEVDDHNAQFKALDSQLSKEVEAQDWTRTVSHSTAASSSSLSHLLSAPPPPSSPSHATPAAARTLLSSAPATPPPAPAAAAAAAAAQARAQATIAAAPAAAAAAGTRGAVAATTAAAFAATTTTAASVQARATSSVADGGAGGARETSTSEAGKERTGRGDSAGRQSDRAPLEQSPAMRGCAAGQAESILVLPRGQGNGSSGDSRESGQIELGIRDEGSDACEGGDTAALTAGRGAAESGAAESGAAESGAAESGAAESGAAAATPAVAAAAAAAVAGQGGGGEEEDMAAAAVVGEVAHVHAASGEASHRFNTLMDGLRQEVTDSQELRAAVSTLSLIVSNARQHPHDSKYHRIRPANPKFHSRVGRFSAALAILEAAGFRRGHERTPGSGSVGGGGGVYEEVLVLQRYDPVLLWLAAGVLEAA